MNLYFAPMEGITTCTFRNTHKEMFEGCDEYFAPFITPSDNEKVTRKGLKDVLPEKNITNLKVQVLTNSADAFMPFAQKVKLVGYDEVNINLGCPSATVVGKWRGSGLLRDIERLDILLYEIFSKTDIKVSVKTRIGYNSADEAEEIIRVYNKYPLSRLIVHPRVRNDFYNGRPHLDAFEKIYNLSTNKICYNGDIFTVSDYNFITEKFPNLDGIMIGRGAVTNPAIFREIKGGKKLSLTELKDFTYKLSENYKEVLSSDVFTLHKLKEIWIYMLNNFPENKKFAKEVKKSNKLNDLLVAIQKHCC